MLLCWHAIPQSSGNGSMLSIGEYRVNAESSVQAGAPWRGVARCESVDSRLECGTVIMNI